VCVAGQLEGCAGERSFEVCNETGTGTFVAQCPGNSLCTDGRCEQALCALGTTQCVGIEAVATCVDGSGYVDPQACGVGQACDEGGCKDLCTINAKVSSYIGCEYWSTDLDNYDDAIGQPHAIVVSNPNPELTAEIVVTRGYEGVVDHGGPAEIAPGGQGVYLIPPTANISAVEVSDFAFRVTSNIPVTAHQFNPLNNVDVYSNDGTLLLPTNALGTDYLAMSWEMRGQPPLRGFVTIVNTSGQDNRVTVTVSAATAPGPEITRMAAGELRDFLLGPGQVLNLETAEAMDDLTGTLVHGQLPVAVFGGHECANVVVGIDRCDHIESQLFPIATWSTLYVGTKFFPRGSEPDIWRIMAVADGTTIQTDPWIEGVTGAILQAGRFVEFESRRDFVLETNQPVSVGHYMVGSNWFGIPRVCNSGIDAGNPTGIGDPALTMAVPVSQYRTDYLLLTPGAYAEDYLNIVTAPGTVVILDGEPVPEEAFEPVGDEDERFVVAHMAVADGPHRLESDGPFGLDAYGYDCHVSYAYPGGLNLED